jgi:large subunit ribosomal protein L29
MNAQELRDKSVKELQEDLVGLYKDQFNYRMQNSSGQLAQVHLISSIRKDIARVKTIIDEKKNLEKKQKESEA